MKYMNNPNKTAYYHLPGLFEFYDLYKIFLSIYYTHREYFYEWCQIGSIYGAPADCIWGGGRVGFGDYDALDVLKLTNEYNISARLSFSNSLLSTEDLKDRKCNYLCKLFEGGLEFIQHDNKSSQLHSNKVTNGVIVHSDLLLDYLKEKYPNLYLVSSTTKVITDFNLLVDEINRDDFLYVVPDFRLNKSLDNLEQLTIDQKRKVEFLVNECCWFACKDRKKCYEDVSRKSLGYSDANDVCKAPHGDEGYSFVRAMENPGFISLNDILSVYMPMGFSNFKIEGRGLGSAMVLEFLLYYLTKPEYQIHVREAIYLDNMLDLF